MSRNKINSGNRGQKGLYFIMGAVLIATLIILVAVIFGLGRVTADKARLQAVNNLMAMAAIEAFMDCTEDTTSGDDAVPGCINSANYSGKANAALVAANKFARLNALQGAALPLGDLNLESVGGGDGGAVSFGRWVQEASGADTCTTYPCYIRNDDACSDMAAAGCGVNAVRVRFNTQPDNPILLPLGRIVGTDAIAINTVATASVIPRCTAFVLDVSGSSSAETHQRFEKLGPPLVPSYPSSFSIRSWPVLGNPDSTPSGFLCGEHDYDYSYNPRLKADSEDHLHWCNSTLMPNLGERTAKYDGNSFRHYYTDYLNNPLRGDPFGPITIQGPTVTRPKILFDRFVDRSGSKRYEGPQPLVSFLQAFNAGLQQMRRQSVGGDRAAVIGFRDTVVTNAVADTARNLSSKFGFLLQLTNPNNRGTFSWDKDHDQYEAEDPEVRPNFLDAGWFPQFTDDGQPGTDLYSALESALISVSSCPASAKKMIIVATDGIPNCSSSAMGDPGFDCNTATFCPDCDATADKWASICNQGFKCRDVYSAYRYNEKRMLDLNSGSLLSRLIEGKVAVTVLLRGDSVNPNFMNVLSPTTQVAMDQPEARSLGYGGPLSCPGGATGCLLKYFDYSTNNDRSNYSTKSTGPPFLRPNGLMGDIAFRTGGIWCPLQDKLPDNGDYEEIDGIYTLKTDVGPGGTRTVGSTETRPLYNLSLGGQAIKCIKNAIGGIPFTLVEGNN